MSIEIDVLIESYTTLKEYIPQKDRQEASDTLASFLVDVLTDHEFSEFGNTDSYTRKSMKEYQSEDSEDDDMYDE